MQKFIKIRIDIYILVFMQINHKVKNIHFKSNLSILCLDKNNELLNKFIIYKFFIINFLKKLIINYLNMFIFINFQIEFMKFS